MINKKLQILSKFTKDKNLDFKIIEEIIRDRRLNKYLGKVTTTIETYNKNGTIAIKESDIEKAKSKAKREIIELKKYLVLGIITQEDYDKKSKPLKKILLGNQTIGISSSFSSTIYKPLKQVKLIFINPIGFTSSFTEM